MKNQYRINYKENTVEITLNSKKYGDKTTVIDLDDLDLVRQFPNKWYVYWKEGATTFYVRGNTVNSEGKRTGVYLHRYLFKNESSVPMIDHVNHNGLDNRRGNLRFVDNQENSQNRNGAYSSTKTGIRGVAVNPCGKFEASINVNYKKGNLGYFDTVEEAEQTASIARAIYMPKSTFDQQAYPFLIEGDELSYFRYGTMNSKKSYYLLKTVYIYENIRDEFLLLTSGKDDRYGVGKITSRLGLQRNAIPINENVDIGFLVDKFKPTRIICDEAHLIDTKCLEQLLTISKDRKIKIFFYGLVYDFKKKYFDSSEFLLKNCEVKQNFPHICEMCGEQSSIYHLKLINGTPMYSGEQVEIGGNERYISVCEDCYGNPKQVPSQKESYKKHTPSTTSNILPIIQHKNSFGVNLKKYLKDNNIPPSKLAKECGMNLITLQKVFSGDISHRHQKRHQTTINKILNYLNISEFTLI